MTDPVRAAADDRAGKRANWLAGRSDRMEYWAYVLMIVAILAIMSMVGFDAGSGVSAGAMFVIHIRRLHDLGLSGWWALALMVGQFAVAIPLAFLGLLGVVLAVLVGLAVLVAMGAIPGQPGENRFGPPRAKRSLREVFR